MTSPTQAVTSAGSFCVYSTLGQNRIMFICIVLNTTTVLQVCKIKLECSEIWPRSRSIYNLKLLMRRITNLSMTTMRKKIRLNLKFCLALLYVYLSILCFIVKHIPWCKKSFEITSYYKLCTVIFLYFSVWKSCSLYSNTVLKMLVKIEVWSPKLKTSIEIMFTQTSTCPVYTVCFC